MMGTKLRACGGKTTIPNWGKWTTKERNSMRRLWQAESRKIEKGVRRYSRIEIADQIADYDDERHYAYDNSYYGDEPMNVLSWMGVSTLAHAHGVSDEHAKSWLFDYDLGKDMPVECACEYCNVKWYHDWQEWAIANELVIAKLRAARDKLIPVIAEIKQRRSTRRLTRKQVVAAARNITPA